MATGMECGKARKMRLTVMAMIRSASTLIKTVLPVIYPNMETEAIIRGSIASLLREAIKNPLTAIWEITKGATGNLFAEGQTNENLKRVASRSAGRGGRGGGGEGRGGKDGGWRERTGGGRSMEGKREGE